MQFPLRLVVALPLLIVGVVLSTTTRATPAPGLAAATEIRAGERAKVPLRDAIQIAERHSHGQAVDARLEIQNSRARYFVETFGDGRLWKGHVDARSGRIVGKEMTIAEARLGQADKARVAALRTAKISLSGAAGTVEELQDGKAVNADLTASNGRPLYETEFIRDGRLERSAINPQTGALLAHRTSDLSMLGG
jgi:uncharacterized membrane protein YkoI